MKLIRLSNLGNTCYINSVLQCFLYNEFFNKFQFDLFNKANNILILHQKFNFIKNLYFFVN
jgi:ubiquitin C-terminal hydrolase